MAITIILILLVLAIIYILLPPEEGTIYTDKQFRTVKVVDIYGFAITVFPVTINSFGEIKETGDATQIPWLHFKMFYTKWKMS